MEPHCLDVIIVNFNSTDYTLKCINSVYASSASFKLNIIVIDNGSYDYPERIKQTYPDIDLVINKKNYGFSKAVNIGFERRSGDMTVLLNPDTAVYSGFFEKTVRYMMDNKDVGVLGPKVMDNNGEVQGSARRFPNVLTAIFGRRSPLTRLFPNNPVTKREFVCFNGRGDEPIDADWVSGACMVFRNKALKQTGGFDNRFFMYWEDADFCKRMKTKGWRIVYFPEAKIFHHTGISSDTEPVLSIYHFHKSCFLLCKKHVKRGSWLIMPLAFSGLCFRCLFVMGLNGFMRLKHGTPLRNNKKKYYN